MKKQEQKKQNKTKTTKREQTKHVGVCWKKDNVMCASLKSEIMSPFAVPKASIV